MIPLALAIFTLVALTPLALSLRPHSTGRSRKESALALHRAQIAELDRELAEGRILPAEHATAMLEVQRRLLAAAETPEAEPATSSRFPLAAALAAVPIAAVALYFIAGGRPDLPAQPLAARMARAERMAQQSDELIAELRQRLAKLNQKSPIARQGYMLLGNAEDSRGHLPDAVAAWRHALEIGFDPNTAALVAEAQTRLDGKVTPASADLFRRALAEGAPDAPWRILAEQRLAQSTGNVPTSDAPASSAPVR